MTILFAGSELESFITSGSPAEATTAGTFDSTYARASIRIPTVGTDYVETLPWTARSDLYYSFNWRQAGAGSVGTMVQFYNNSGTPVFRIQHTSALTMQGQYWDGAAWQNIGSTYALAGSRERVDIEIVGGASGSFRLSVENTLRLSGSASMTQVANLTKARHFGNSSSGTASNQTHISAVMAATEVTTTWLLESKPPTSAGTDTDGTGNYLNIDETTLSDADVIALASTGNKQSMKTGARTLASGFIPKGVTVTARAKCGATGPQSLKLYLLISGTRYYSSTIALTTSMAAYEYTWDLNPSTGVAWTSAQASDANLEWGYEAAA